MDGIAGRTASLLLACSALLFGSPLRAGETVFPLQVAPSGRYLIDQTGAPFFVNGATPWSLTHNLTYEEAVRYMEDRRLKGINALIISVPDAYAPDGGFSYPPDRQGQHPFVGNDITQPNEAYWQHVDRVFSKAEEMGFLVLYWPFYLGCCNDGYMSLFQQNGVTRAREYGRFVGRRYGGHENLIWVHGGDHDPDPVRDLVLAVKEGIEEVGPSRLHATHWGPETDPYGPYGDAFTDLYTTYTYGPVASLVSRHYTHAPTKPVILLETHYENDWAGKPAEEVRKYPYRAVLSGAAGHFFGNKPLWFCGYGWEAALDSPGSQSLEWVGRLFNSRPWQLLVPAPGVLVTSGGGNPLSDGGVQAARASSGSFGAVFVPDSRTIQVALSQVSGPTVKAWWYSIATGVATSAGTFPTSGTRGFTSPGGDGYVLVLDDESRAYPPPGSPPSGQFQKSSLAIDQQGNGVLEPDEVADVSPAWKNLGAAVTLQGSIVAFQGPTAAGATYQIVDGVAGYGAVATGQTASCVAASNDCYIVSTSMPTARPATHWDAVLQEELSPGGAWGDWTVHIGESFDDVPTENPFYPFIETLLHRSVTAGCSPTTYCPAQVTSRAQMAVFVLRAKEGGAYTPPPCGSSSVFRDVPTSSPFCPWVEELARRGVVSGCGGRVTG